MAAERDTAPPPDLAHGLSADEAARRLARDGPNELVPPARAPLLRRVLRPLVEPMVVLLAAVGAVYLALGERRDAIVILVAIVPLVAVDLLLDFRMERTLAALAALTRPRARVRRGGGVAEVPTRELVRGDVLLVEEGDVVPADALLAHGADVMTDESALTGEADAVPKAPGAGPDGGGALYAGSTVVSGRGAAHVTATGRATRYGAIGALVAEARSPRTPLQKTLDRLVRNLAFVVAAVCAVMIVVQVLRGVRVLAALLSAAALALAAIPEEFPIVFTLFLSLGAFRLARRKSLVRRWAGVETLGSATVLCTDKTGTLTLGKVSLVELWTPAAGAVTLPHARGADEPAGAAPRALDPSARALLATAARASEPSPFDPLERALFDACRRAGVDPEVPGELVKEHAFVRTHFRMSHIWKLPAGDAPGARGGAPFVLATKGSVEGVAAACDLGDDARARLEAAHQTLAGRGMKVLAVAARPLDSLAGSREQDEAGLELVGLLGYLDPPRAGVLEAVRECIRAGVQVVMITGDHAATAAAIARALGIPHDPDGVLAGADIDRAPARDERELAALGTAVCRAGIVARATPEHKARIVRALQARGEVVAMTGDGINDAPALRRADIGVAMGQRGTEVARAAATMVLLDDAFPTIVVAVAEGRRVYDNIQKAFRYLLAFHVPIVSAALLTPILGLPLMLLPVHIVWLELIVHPVSAIAFEAEPAEPDVMTRPPRPRAAPLLSAREIVRSCALGAALAAVTLALFAWALARGASPAYARGLAMATIVTAQLGLVVTLRTTRAGLSRAVFRENRTLVAVCAAVLASGALVFAVPWLRAVMQVAPLRGWDWALVAACALGSTVWFELVKASQRRAHHRRGHAARRSESRGGGGGGDDEERPRAGERGAGA